MNIYNIGGERYVYAKYAEGQTEHIAHLEAENERLDWQYQEILKRRKEKRELESRIEKLREALGFYANPNGSRVSGLTTHTMYLDDIETHHDCGYSLKIKGVRARQVLKADK